jgi:hypothetical protein
MQSQIRRPKDREVERVNSDFNTFCYLAFLFIVGRLKLIIDRNHGSMGASGAPLFGACLESILS